MFLCPAWESTGRTDLRSPVLMFVFFFSNMPTTSAGPKCAFLIPPFSLLEPRAWARLPLSPSFIHTCSLFKDLPLSFPPSVSNFPVALSISSIDKLFVGIVGQLPFGIFPPPGAVLFFFFDDAPHLILPSPSSLPTSFLFQAIWPTKEIPFPGRCTHPVPATMAPSLTVFHSTLLRVSSIVGHWRTLLGKQSLFLIFPPKAFFLRSPSPPCFQLSPC